MSTWVGAAPVFGTGSLDGFAIGALMSGACVLAITAPRRARARQASAAREGGTLAAKHNGWLREHVMAADAGTERMAKPEELGAPGGGRPAVGREGRTAGGYRSRHRLGDPIPGSAPGEDASPDCASPGGGPANGAFPDSAFPRSRHRARPDAGLPDEALGDRTFGSPRRPEGRPPPRHAAPSGSVGSRMTGFGSRMSSLLAPRALASGARG